MDIIPFNIGRIVLSKQGRDKGRMFMVLEVLNEDFVLVVDGDLRKLAKPKLKRKKHLHAKPYMASEYLTKTEKETIVLDSDIRKELSKYSGMEKGECDNVKE